MSAEAKKDQQERYSLGENDMSPWLAGHTANAQNPFVPIYNDSQFCLLSAHSRGVTSLREGCTMKWKIFFHYKCQFFIEGLGQISSIVTQDVFSLVPYWPCL